MEKDSFELIHLDQKALCRSRLIIDQAARILNIAKVTHCASLNELYDCAQEFGVPTLGYVISASPQGLVVQEALQTIRKRIGDTTNLIMIRSNLKKPESQFKGLEPVCRNNAYLCPQNSNPATLLDYLELLKP